LKVEPVMVAGSILSERVAVTSASRPTPDTPPPGVAATTLGAVVSGTTKVLKAKSTGTPASVRMPHSPSLRSCASPPGWGSLKAMLQE
jgi:hypothetical protein